MAARYLRVYLGLGVQVVFGATRLKHKKWYFCSVDTRITYFYDSRSYFYVKK